MDALEERIGDLSDSVRRYDRSLRSIRTANWKLIRGSDGSRELYDLTTGASESTDVAAENPEIVRDLETELDEWLESYDRRRADDDVELDQTTKRRLEELGYLR
jgi:arylsulfatase A-like enzyme